jgi:hypothetical protein
MTSGSYYFWKWADNDLPGRPTEVHAALLHGEMHAAVQIFDARPLLKKLERVAAQGRKRGEEWYWEVTPRGASEQARFVFVTCPIFNASRKRATWFGNHFLPFELSGVEEGYGRLIPCMRPKLSQFIPGQCPEETAYDIAPDELPILLRQIVPGFSEAWAELLDRYRGVVAIAKGRRFRVEWREYFDWKKPRQFKQWRAKYPKQFDTPRCATHERSRAFDRDTDLLLFADTLRIFKAFLRGEPRPSQYRWQAVKNIAP